MLCSRFFFHSFLFYFCRIVGVTRGTNVLPERLKFRILFREHLIWKSHLPSSLKIHNPSIFKILWTVNNAKVQIISRFEHNFPFKFTDNRISISDCILLYRRRKCQECGAQYSGRRWILLFWCKRFQKVIDRSNFQKRTEKNSFFFWRRLNLS